MCQCGKKSGLSSSTCVWLCGWVERRWTSPHASEVSTSTYPPVVLCPLWQNAPRILMIEATPRRRCRLFDVVLPELAV